MLNIIFQFPLPTDGLSPMQEHELENRGGGELKDLQGCFKYDRVNDKVKNWLIILV